MSDYQNYIVITNRHLCQGDYLSQLKKVTALHPHALILREKDLTEAEYEDLAKTVLELCQESHVPCFLHSHVDAAQRLGCRNLHLSISGLRENVGKLGGSFNLSVSCHSLADAKEAAQAGATQVILGNIFETDCKKGLPGKGLGFLREICAHLDIPVYAIGGISPQNFPQVIHAGAAGGCMMSGFMRL